ncbi:MAG: response regulator [Sphingobacteriales bacterium]|nr:MAG: response regulator [Sphingobacteriales bacterium]
MNRLLNNLTLPVKLALIGLIPLVFLVYLAIQAHDAKIERLVILDKFKSSVASSARIVTLIDELQTERRLSFKYAISKSENAEMKMQREKTDAALASLPEETDVRFQNFRVYTFLDQLSAMRSRIDESNMAALEVMNYYTNVIFRLNSLSAVYTENVPYLEPVAKDLRAMRLLNEMISYLGITRGSLYYALYTSQDPRLTATQIKGIQDIYRSYETEFYVKSSDSAIYNYKEKRNAGVLKTTLTLLDTLAATGTLDTSYDAEEWWVLSASAVDQLKAMQRMQVKRIVEKVDDIYGHENAEKDRNLVILILLIALTIALVFYTIKNISENLTTLRIAAQKLAVGETGINLKVKTKDVIGSLAASVLEVDRSNKELAAAADAIGRGDFDVPVSQRSKGDVLGTALVRMKEDLARFTAENEEKMWMQEGLTAINNATRGENNVDIVAKNALEALATYMKAEVGILYIAHGDTLAFAAGHALSDRKKAPIHVPFGETLLGQAALKKEVIQLSNVPDDFVRISSATSEAQPNNVIIVPLVHNDVTEGVVELATLFSFNPAAEKLLTQAGNSIAIAIQGAKSRTRLQEFLEETQSQAEELQAQHNELENINAELEAQAQKLQTSEEELKVQQEELMHANQELEENTRALEERNQLIVERNYEIQRKAEDLALATKYKSEFLANMSHELRTPLNSILLLSRLLSENNEQNLNEEQVEYAQVIQTSGNGLLNLIDEILDLSKIESGKMQLEYGTVLLKEVVGDMRALFMPIANEKRIELRLNISQDVPSTIDTDKMRVEQIIKNLMSNALKFTSQGYVSLDVSAEGKDYVVFKVKDTGVGIPEDKQQLVFEAFQQADGSTRRKFGGTGLGLSISRELARLLGGEIFLQSKVGEGSEFSVKIPVSKAAAKMLIVDAPEVVTEIPAADPEEEPVEKAERPRFISSTIPASLPDDRESIKPGDQCILIIEDDTPFAKALMDYTRKQGYKALSAVRGDEGIELARQFAPVGILLDIQLPVKDGWEVLEELKQDRLTRHIPVHTMSSNEFKKESLTKGAVNFINKPVALEQMRLIFDKLEHVLNREHKKVLIVEENPQHAKALAYFLENFNVAAEVRHDIHAGVEALRTDDVDCVILDMGMPTQKAYEMLEEVKKNTGLEHLPVIVFTGKSLSKNEESKIRQYADSIVVKTAHSYKRILDEVSLFLHLVEEGNKPQTPVRNKRLGALEEVLKDKTVLIADDDVRNIFSLSKALEQKNMKVITAIDGKEALNQLEQNPAIDIVLMDMMMPEMDGYESTTRIRQNSKFRNLPIIAVTAKAMAGDREKCIAAGASDYISKPVDIDQMLSLLRVWLYDRSI